LPPDSPSRQRQSVLSYALVAAQFALLVVIAVPWSAADVQWPGIASLAALGAGVALGGWALTANRPGNFNIRPDPKDGGLLATRGPYRWVRHPMYGAVLLVAAGGCLAYAETSRWLAWLALAVVLHTKATLEERALTARHADYAAYVRRTKRIVPFVW
jgi:protein-S-isoprenylcysteine O-methyltransferase Ste14